MLHSIATVSISGSLEDKIDAIAAAGFGGIEIFENDLITCPLAPAEIGRLMKQAGLVCTAYQPFRDFEGMPDDDRPATFERARRKFEIMNQLGAKVMLVCSNVSPRSSGDRDRIVRDFRELGELAASFGVTVGYEALAWGRHVWDHRDVWEIVRQVDHPHVGIILDSFHSLSRDIPNTSLLSIDPAKIALVQLADAPRLDMSHLYWSRHFRNMPGQGELDVHGYVQALKDIGYDGPISLEIFNDQFRAGLNRRIALDGRRSLIVLDDETHPPPLGAIPAHVQTRGVAFVEFSVNDEEQAALATMLQTLGFRHDGAHRTKAVTRYRCGDAVIVLNAERDGFAHAYNATHGCAVCAIGIRVENRVDALARARHLKIPVFEESVGASEYAMPAIRGVGGSLIYFMDEAERDLIWAREFNLTPDTNEAGPEAAAGFTAAFDHIAQIMGYEDMLSWILFYTSLFDTRKGTLNELTDPLGIVLSQSVQTGDGALRFTLNSSAARQTLASRSLDNYFGGGVQHIALRTDDIRAVAARLRQNAADILKIPANYYEDLAAKFKLDAPTVDDLRDNCILYDRDGENEYFQIYSRAFDRRVFFEFVERRGYTGYGAANAPVRMAAQSRYKPTIED